MLAAANCGGPASHAPLGAGLRALDHEGNLRNSGGPCLRKVSLASRIIRPVSLSLAQGIASSIAIDRTDTTLYAPGFTAPPFGVPVIDQISLCTGVTNTSSLSLPASARITESRAFDWADNLYLFAQFGVGELTGGGTLTPVLSSGAPGLSGLVTPGLAVDGADNLYCVSSLA